MKSSLQDVIDQLPDVVEEARFNRQDLLVILQGITGFYDGIAGTAIDVAGYFATKCNSGTLKENLGNIDKWLTFGKEYAALEDSSDLDFDKMDIGSVPEVMKVMQNPNYHTEKAICSFSEIRLIVVHNIV